MEDYILYLCKSAVSFTGIMFYNKWQNIRGKSRVKV